MPFRSEDIPGIWLSGNYGQGPIVGGLFRALMNLPLFKSALRPVTRVLVGVIAIPIFRFIMRKLFRLQDLDDELEKDLEEWFRGALLLLAASANMEHLLFGWMSRVDWLDRADWLTMGLRLMLAIGVIEAMPDQELFAVIHPGPPKLKPGRSVLIQFWKKRRAFLKGVLCQHLNRSSPVLAMLCAIVGAQLHSAVDHSPAVRQQQSLVAWTLGQEILPCSPAGACIAVCAAQQMAPDLKALDALLKKDQAEQQRNRERWLVGWCCYLLAITQYLIIGLVTSRDRAMDVLSEFDRAVAQRRRELIEEFQLTEEPSAEPPTANVLPAADGPSAAGASAAPQAAANPSETTAPSTEP